MKEAVQKTLVSPKEMRTEPSACLLHPRSMVTGRSCSGVRPSMRDMPVSLVGAHVREDPVRRAVRVLAEPCRAGGLSSHHVFDLAGDRVGVGADDDLDRGAHLDDAVGAGGLQRGFVDEVGVDDLGAQAGDAALDLFDVLDTAEPGDDLLSLVAMRFSLGVTKNESRRP